MLFVLISYLIKHFFQKMRIFIIFVKNKGHLLFNKVKGHRVRGCKKLIGAFAINYFASN